jgi:hypothetical protein
VPAAHGAAAVLEVQSVPTGQVVHAATVPGLLKVPSGHAWHASTPPPAGLYSPGLQLVGVADFVVQSVPSGHGVHDDWPTAFWYDPFSHAVQVVAPAAE